MLIEIVFKNGSKDRRLCSASTTVVDFVRQAEEERGSKIQSMRVVKRNEPLTSGVETER